MTQAVPGLHAAVLTQLWGHTMSVTSGHHIQSLTCYPPRQVIGGLDGRLLVVDTEVHHVDVTVAGAGGRGRQQALQNQVSILNLRLFKCRIGRRQTELRDLWSQVRDLMSRVLLSPEQGVREGGLTGDQAAPGLAVSHQKLIKLLFSAQTIIIFATRAAVKDG